MVESTYLSEKSSDFDKSWYTASYIAPDDSLVTKNWNFYNLRWRRPPSWKSLFRPISANFYEEAEQHVDKGYVTKTANFQNPRWRTAAILKTIKSPYISEKLYDFDETWYITSGIWTWWQSRDQKLKFFKFKMVAAAILKIAFLAITHEPIVRFQRNFVWASRTACW